MPVGLEVTLLVRKSVSPTTTPDLCLIAGIRLYLAYYWHVRGRNRLRTLGATQEHRFEPSPAGFGNEFLQVSVRGRLSKTGKISDMGSTQKNGMVVHVSKRI